MKLFKTTALIMLIALLFLCLVACTPEEEEHEPTLEEIQAACPHKRVIICLCVDCQKEFHEIGNDCICTKCNKTIHNYDASCKCKECGLVTHGIKEGNYCIHGTEVYFGYYPQSEVEKGSVTESSLNVMTSKKVDESNPLKDWTSYPYYVQGKVKSDVMYYKDLTLGGEKYRAVYINEYRPASAWNASIANYSNQDEDGYELGKYYFKYELIKWKIVKVDGNVYTLMADSILDNQPYRARVNRWGQVSDANQNPLTNQGYPSNWKDSDLRSFLNGTFLTTAFSMKDKDMILATTIDAKIGGELNGGNKFIASDAVSNDKVFAPSYADCFHSSLSVNLKKNQTAYAVCQGDNTLGNDYWLRSAWVSSETDETPSIRTIDKNGKIDSVSGSAYAINGGVVPMIRVLLS